MKELFYAIRLTHSLSPELGWWYAIKIGVRNYRLVHGKPKPTFKMYPGFREQMAENYRQGDLPHMDLKSLDRIGSNELPRSGGFMEGDK